MIIIYNLLNLLTNANKQFLSRTSGKNKKKYLPQINKNKLLYTITIKKSCVKTYHLKMLQTYAIV